MAYVAGSDPFKGYWDCAEILLGTARTDVKHEAQLPFVFWDIKEERGDWTTRP